MSEQYDISKMRSELIDLIRFADDDDIIGLDRLIGGYAPCSLLVE